MRYEDVISHMAEHGFVTRASWNGNSLVHFGMDNVLESVGMDGSVRKHTPSLNDYKGNDWVILPFWYDGPKTNDEALLCDEVRTILKSLGAELPTKPAV